MRNQPFGATHACKHMDVRRTLAAPMSTNSKSRNNANEATMVA